MISSRIQLRASFIFGTLYWFFSFSLNVYSSLLNCPTVDLSCSISLSRLLMYSFFLCLLSLASVLFLSLLFGSIGLAALSCSLFVLFRPDLSLASSWDSSSLGSTFLGLPLFFVPGALRFLLAGVFCLRASSFEEMFEDSCSFMLKLGDLSINCSVVVLWVVIGLSRIQSWSFLVFPLVFLSRNSLIVSSFSKGLGSSSNF
mmetsp:Transcript_36314/g.35912  ORF Transcript_36314/g.35912 Transcript_36314/m.35912 type:complete len:201 (-) Transcript_36314:81-683(-)